MMGTITTMTDITPLQPEQLRSCCNPDQFAFQTTDELPDLSDMLGQDRALAALRFGIGMPNSGYNLFALGPAGAGKYTTVSRFLKEKAATEPVPNDWVYVNKHRERYSFAAAAVSCQSSAIRRSDFPGSHRSIKPAPSTSA